MAAPNCKSYGSAEDVCSAIECSKQQGRTRRFGGCGPVELLQLLIQCALLAAAASMDVLPRERVDPFGTR
jgi:hypothetical protein